MWLCGKAGFASLLAAGNAVFGWVHYLISVALKHAASSVSECAEADLYGEM